jgi:hypothetical protein
LLSREHTRKKPTDGRPWAGFPLNDPAGRSSTPR